MTNKIKFIRNTPPTPPKFLIKARINLDKHKPHYILSENQANKLLIATNSDIGVAWVCPLPKPDDEHQIKIDLTILNQELVDLEALGLASNVTEQFAVTAEQVLRQSNRHVHYFAPTKIAFQMFEGSKERILN